LEIANADLRRAKVLWLPTLNTGVDYFRHDGRIQDVVGTLFDTSKSSFMVGVGPTAVFAVTDAVFAPLAARQLVQARDAGIQTARNDSLLAVAESYFTLQQARGDLAGAEDAAARADEVVRRAEVLSSGGIVASVEVARARTEAARRRQLCQSAWERWQSVSAELVRLLRLETTTTLQPVEPPHLQMTLIPQDRTVDDLIPIALLNRPELASHQALVQATLQQLRAEKLRPLVPSVLLRGTSTVPGGTLATGVFGGGVNGSMGNFAARGDLDLQVIWELQNLGLGNRARIEGRRAEHRLALVELMRVQDRVAAEVVTASAQVQAATARMADAELGMKEAIESATKNLEALGQTGGAAAGRPITLLVRPQEVVQSVQALAQAYSDYFGTIADYNRSQFRLYRALGQPAQLVTEQCPEVGDASGGAPMAKHSSTPKTLPMPQVEWRSRPATEASPRPAQDHKKD
jgi:outer membrane protein TolC